MRVEWEEARSMSMTACAKLGFDDSEALIITDHLMDGAARGQGYAGLPRILVIADRVRAMGKNRRSERIVHDTPTSQLIDGGGNLGYTCAHRATRTAIAKALDHGVGLVGVRDCYYTGNQSYYAEMATRADLVAIVASNGFRALAPHGAAEAVVGPNPLAFGFPSNDDPIIWDASSSAITQADVRTRERIGELLPPGVAIDASGRPTLDPTEALLGALLPWGGHRGSGLAIVVQLLGMLCDTAPVMDTMEGWGFFILVFRIDLLMETERFKRRAADLSRHVREARPTGDTPPRAPFERSAETRRRLQGQPMEVPDAVYHAILAL